MATGRGYNFRDMTQAQFEEFQAQRAARRDRAILQAAPFTPEVEPEPKPGKYGNKKVEVDGIKFDSKKEAKRYGELKWLAETGQISELELQKSFRLEVNNYLIAHYRADFVYYECGKRIIEDCKGFRTPVYKLKKKLMLAIYGIEIRET